MEEDLCMNMRCPHIFVEENCAGKCEGRKGVISIFFAYEKREPAFVAHLMKGVTGERK